MPYTPDPSNLPWCLLGFKLTYDINKVVLLGTAGEQLESGLGYNTMGFYYRYLKSMTAMSFDAPTETVTIITTGSVFNQPV